jgi:hypothetical protein
MLINILIGGFVLLLIAQMSAPFVEGFFGGSSKSMGKSIEELKKNLKNAEELLRNYFDSIESKIPDSDLQNFVGRLNRVIEKIMPNIQNIKNNERLKNARNMIKGMISDFINEINERTKQIDPTIEPIKPWTPSWELSSSSSSSSNMTDILAKANENRVTVDKVNQLIDSKIGKIASDVRDIVNGQLSKFDQKITALEAKIMIT